MQEEIDKRLEAANTTLKKTVDEEKEVNASLKQTVDEQKEVIAGYKDKFEEYDRLFGQLFSKLQGDQVCILLVELSSVRELAADWTLIAAVRTTADLAGENTKVLRESEGEEASATAEEEVFGSKRQKLPPSKEDPWPPDRSLGTIVSLHQISRRRRLVAADLVGENAEVLPETEGEEASTAAEEEVFGLEVSERNLLLYSV
ncbi:uncharacterized protein G2W53_015152 [Senna tora]|uniref:Uncharacterized protein n=1 Tax=Senna tora TaxID=362788 RepID=A0A834WV26_9FABA|nr:uncharacterized protein G2W53_015152 [Senna tora]